MSWPLPFKRDNSAPVARERLQILLAEERSALGRPNLISILIDTLAAVSRHVAVEPDKVEVKVARGGSVSTLAIEVDIPNMTESSHLSWGTCIESAGQNLQAGECGTLNDLECT